METTPDAPQRVFLFSYDFQGSSWSLEIPAKSAAEAQMRLMKLANANFDGEVCFKIAVPTGPFAWLRKVMGL